MNESTARNIRVQDRYDELMRIGRHGHYETMFQVVREETESLRQQLASQREAFAVIAETPVSGEQDDITMEAKDRIAKAIREWEPK